MGSKPKTTQHVRDVFYRMGFDDREIVALLGAHAIGRCYPGSQWLQRSVDERRVDVLERVLPSVVGEQVDAEEVERSAAV
ncbi:hypothetical protein PINS_up023286 [Pythium insidiosum]|nr:hypothetical protein PINS_up023286 [Pythium insidiosum]